jgi:hypothetical protein
MQAPFATALGLCYSSLQEWYARCAGERGASGRSREALPITRGMDGALIRALADPTDLRRAPLSDLVFRPEIGH